MQLGSGTFDLTPSITYTMGHENWALGSQLNATLRLGRNSNDYSLGNAIALSGWGSYQLSDGISTSLRLNASQWGNIDGADNALNANLVPTSRTDLRGGKRVDALIGVDFSLPEMQGHRLAVEGGAPIYENLDGPQLSTDWRLSAGWQLAF